MNPSDLNPQPRKTYNDIHAEDLRTLAKAAKPGVLAVMDFIIARDGRSHSDPMINARATVERLAVAAEAFVAMYADEPNEEDSFVNPVAFEMRAALAAYDAARDNGETFVKVPEQPTGDHTATPWTYSHGTVMASDEVAFDCDPQQVGKPGEAEANARRIVACVNACAGIRTDWLEADELARLFPRILETRRAPAAFRGDA